MENFKSINPYNQSLLGEYPVLNHNEADAKLDELHRGYQAWRAQSREARLSVLPKLASLLHAQKEACAALISLEMGKPITQSRAEIDKCIGVCEYYFEHGLALLESQETENYHHFPLGVIIGVMPWNFPFWQALRFAIPTLIAGNAVLVKHAPNVPQCAKTLESIFREVMPEPTPFLSPFLSIEGVHRMIHHPQVRGASLTGSNRAGRAIGAAAGQACIPCVLELGGSVPFIVCADADIATAAQVAATARCTNAGQVCIAAKRLILAESIKDQFLHEFETHCRAYTSGDPLNESTTLGPLARPDIKSALAAQVSDSVNMGATTLFQCENQRTDGNFFQITCLSNVRADMPVVAAETFGPVISVHSAVSDNDALALANQTQFGLGAAVWTKDESRAKWFYDRLDVGVVGINAQVRSDYSVPFGGTKQSGFGRELAASGLVAFTNGKARLA